jgi:hypothetical protein
MCFQATTHGCLDCFDVQRHAFAAFKLLDALIDVAEKLFPMSQQIDGSV